MSSVKKENLAIMTQEGERYEATAAKMVLSAGKSVNEDPACRKFAAASSLELQV